MNNKWIEETHGWRKEIVKNNPTNANILLDRLLEMSDWLKEIWKNNPTCFDNLDKNNP